MSGLWRPAGQELARAGRRLGGRPTAVLAREQGAGVGRTLVEWRAGAGTGVRRARGGGRSRAGELAWRRRCASGRVS
jgi:hypothetical protein